MINKTVKSLLVVAHPDDELLVFSTILFDESNPPWVIVCSEGLSSRRKFLDRLFTEKKIPGVVFSSNASNLDQSINQEMLQKFLKDNAPSSIETVWTHNPSDMHPQHRETALAVSCVFSDCRIFYSHGISFDEYQFIADVCNNLSNSELCRKIDLLNTEYADQLLFHRRWGSAGFTTESILSVEKFVELSSVQAQKLYALRNSENELAATVKDPWEFESSSYEMDRLQATVKWVREWVHPENDSICEIGACEGVFTNLLINTGYQKLTVIEPNLHFREPLESLLKRKGIQILSFTIQEYIQNHKGKYFDVCFIFEAIYYFDDFTFLDDVPSDCLLLSCEDETFYGRLLPWISSGSTWRIVDERLLNAPRIEFCVADKVYKRKAGSRGVVLYRKNLLR